jgi:hypothetical protein
MYNTIIKLLQSKAECLAFFYAYVIMSPTKI